MRNVERERMDGEGGDSGRCEGEREMERGVTAGDVKERERWTV